MAFSVEARLALPIAMRTGIRLHKYAGASSSSLSIRLLAHTHGGGMAQCSPRLGRKRSHSDALNYYASDAYGSSPVGKGIKLRVDTTKKIRRVSSSSSDLFSC